jgi:PadR family transcriptional regulator, regulatory protein PadR
VNYLLYKSEFVAMISKLEELILFAVLRGSGSATASDVQAALSDATKKEQSFGSVFTTLDRLSDKKFVKWRKGEPDGRRGGRAPRLYEITGAGRKALDEAVRATHIAAGGTKSLEPWGAPRFHCQFEGRT